MIQYRFLSPAEDEMIEAALFFEGVASGLGSDFLNDVQRAINKVRQYPQAGQLVAPPFRRTLLHRFPFSLIYVTEANFILIVAVLTIAANPATGGGEFCK